MTHAVKFLLFGCLTMAVPHEQVMRVIDGDTFILYAVGVTMEERVRVLGVNTPEIGKPQAADATAFTRAWLAEGPFTLTACKRDSFGRLLADVSRKESRLAEALRAQGFAQ